MLEASRWGGGWKCSSQDRNKNLPTLVFLLADNPHKWPRNWQESKVLFLLNTFRTHSNEPSFYTQTNTIKPYGNQSGTICGKNLNNYLSFIISSTSNAQEYSTQLLNLRQATFSSAKATRAFFSFYVSTEKDDNPPCTCVGHYLYDVVGNPF